MGKTGQFFVTTKQTWKTPTMFIFLGMYSAYLSIIRNDKPISILNQELYTDNRVADNTTCDENPK